MEKLWIIDCETTGIFRTSSLLEFGGLVLNKEMEILDKFEIVINYPIEMIKMQCSQEVFAMHEKSGLINRVLESKISIYKAKEIFLELIEKHKSSIKPVLVNNTVRMDYMWLEENFKNQFINSFNYRTIDVSSLNQLYNLWSPLPKEKFEIQKEYNHTALADAIETYKELKLYYNLIKST